jgi:hypothetical protein
MGGSCSMTENKFKMHTQLKLERLKHRDHVGDLCADEKKRRS